MLVPADSLSLAIKTSPCSASITTARNTGFGSAMLRAGARSKTKGRLSDVLLASCATAAPDQCRVCIHHVAVSIMAATTLHRILDRSGLLAIFFSSLLWIH